MKITNPLIKAITDENGKLVSEKIDMLPPKNKIIFDKEEFALSLISQTNLENDLEFLKENFKFLNIPLLLKSNKIPEDIINENIAKVSLEFYLLLGNNVNLWEGCYSAYSQLGLQNYSTATYDKVLNAVISQVHNPRAARIGMGNGLGRQSSNTKFQQSRGKEILSNVIRAHLFKKVSKPFILSHIEDGVVSIISVFRAREDILIEDVIKNIAHVNLEELETWENELGEIEFLSGDYLSDFDEKEIEKQRKLIEFIEVKHAEYMLPHPNSTKKETKGDE